MIVSESDLMQPDNDEGPIHMSDTLRKSIWLTIEWYPLSNRIDGQLENDESQTSSFFSPGKSVRTNGAFTKFDPLNTIDSSLSQSTLINCSNSHVQFEGHLLGKTMFFQTWWTAIEDSGESTIFDSQFQHFQLVLDLNRRNSTNWNYSHQTWSISDASNCQFEHQ